MQELEEYKKKVKDNVENLINNGFLDEAKMIITECEELLPADADIYSFKGIIAMIKGNMEEAESILKEGSGIFQDSFDIFYNLGYLYQVTDRAEIAKNYYKRALVNSVDDNEELSAYNVLADLGVKESKEDIISSVIADYYYNYAVQCDDMGNKSDAALYYGLSYKYCKENKVREKLKKTYIDNKVLNDIFSVASNSNKKRFIVLSSCDWGEVQQRMHHISKALAKLENEVIYITPKKEINFKTNNNIDNNIIIEELVKYSIENYKNIDGVNIYSPIFVKGKDNEKIDNYTEIVQKMLDNSRDETNTVIISYMPYQVNIIKKLKGNFMHIYDCVDDHSDLDYAFWGTKEDAIWEQELMDVSNAITTTATSLYLQRKSIEGRRNVYFSRNAVNESDFIIQDNKIPDDLKSIPEPRVVYSGAIYDWFDKELFYDVVKSNPDKSFVIIGFGNEEILNEKCRNLYILGAKKHSELKTYLNYCHVGIIPFKDDIDLIVNCDPIKQYEYIACGLPVIATNMPEVAIDKIYTYLANTKDDFNSALEKCLNLKIDKNKIGQFVAENSWNKRASLLCKIADNNVNEKDDILINIGKNLDLIVERYKQPIFKTLKSLYMNLSNTDIFESISEEAYKENNNKYIERQHLTSLLLNSKIDKFVDVVLNSTYIRSEIKEEILYCKEKKSFKYIRCLLYICIGNLRQAIIEVDKIKNNDIKIIYSNYIEFLLSDKNYDNEIDFESNTYQESPLVKFLRTIINENKNREKIFISNLFNSISDDFINALLLNNTIIEGYINESIYDPTNNLISIEKIRENQNKEDIRIIVEYDVNYIKQIRMLAENGIKECDVALIFNNQVAFINIDEKLMNSIKNKEYNKTITFNRFNAADGNVHALIKYIPDEYKKKYNLNVINGRDVWSLDNIVKVPLKSNVTVSGFSTFLYNYPKFTYNIELGHAGVIMKTCGALDKKDKNSGGNSELYEKMDCMCIDSHLNMVLNSAFYGIPENKYNITGLPRYDIFSKVDSKNNLERLLGITLKNKKVIFNMPTFHVFDQANRIEGSPELTDSIKVFGFNYKKFNDFLVENDIICVSKVHHGEEKSVSAKNIGKNYSNMYFINNNDLDNCNLNLYEILGAGDMLITDYSTVYNDFLFLDKPIIFACSDIEDYRRERGLALEPYDFWTAGPKVLEQDKLQSEIVKCANGIDEYKRRRYELRSVFFNYDDSKSINRVWKLIDSKVNSVLEKEGFTDETGSIN